MKKLLLSVSCWLILLTPTYSKTIRTFTPLVPQNSAPQFQPMRSLVPEEEQNAPNENYPKITELEYHLFHRDFAKENIYSRLTRLENKIFRQSYTGLPLSNRVENILSNIDEGIFYGIKNQDLLKLETRVLGRTYPNDDTATRITRLEKEMLGAMQSGNLKNRFETVKLAAKHYNTYPEIAQNTNFYNQSYGYSSQPNYRGMGINGFLQNLTGKLFGDLPMGTMTGYTPPIYDTYNQYSPYSNYGFQDYNMGNTGGYYRNRNYGGNSTVRILN